MNLRMRPTADLSSVDSAKTWLEQGAPANKIQNDAKPLKEKTIEVVETKVKAAQDELEDHVEEAVESLNATMEHISRGLRFSIHEDTQRMMVKVVNIRTNEVLKEIPAEDVLDTAARIREMIGVLLDERA